LGAKILADSKAEILKAAEQIAIFHHEEWNGTEYPQGLAGNIVPKAARIAGLADVFLENIHEILIIKSEIAFVEHTSLSGFAWSEQDRAEKDNSKL
jgi:hypothetical protein